MNDFVGAKAALMIGDTLVMYLRDDKPGLRFANMWDFPGGGREGDETSFECIARETQEEFGIVLKPESVVWQKKYPAMHDPTLSAYFFVIKISQGDVDQFNFGSEGQRWELVDVPTFMSRDDVVPHLKTRLQDYLDATIAV